MRREQVHILVFLGQLKGDIRDHHAKAQRLDADFFIRILALGIKKAQNIRVMGVQIYRAGTLPRAKLVGVGERILQQFHHGDDAGGLVFDPLDRGTLFANVGQHQRNATATLAKLQGRIDAAPDAFHVVFEPQQETGYQLSAALLSGVKECGRGGLETPRQDFVHERHRLHLIATRQR